MNQQRRTFMAETLLVPRVRWIVPLGSDSNGTFILLIKRILALTDCPQAATYADFKDAYEHGPCEYPYFYFTILLDDLARANDFSLHSEGANGSDIQVNSLPLQLSELEKSLRLRSRSKRIPAGRNASTPESARDNS